MKIPVLPNVCAYCLHICIEPRKNTKGTAWTALLPTWINCKCFVLLIILLQIFIYGCIQYVLHYFYAFPKMLSWADILGLGVVGQPEQIPWDQPDWLSWAQNFIIMQMTIIKKWLETRPNLDWALNYGLLC